MPLYEHVFLVRQDVSAQQVEALLQTFRSIIETGGGSIGKTEYWGVKSLAFRIKKNRKAHFALMNLDAPPGAVTELERQERLSTDVIRFITVKVEEGKRTLVTALSLRNDKATVKLTEPGAYKLVAVTHHDDAVRGRKDLGQQMGDEDGAATFLGEAADEVHIGVNGSESEALLVLAFVGLEQRIRPLDRGEQGAVTLDATDPISFQTDFKKCAVKIVKVPR